MKKSIVVIVIIAIILIVFAVVKIVTTNKNDELNINVEKLAEDLINAQIFDDYLSQIDAESVTKKYGFDNEKIKNINSYAGTGATAEEILIIELINKNDINEIKKAIQTQIEERKADFLNYLPKEVFKLENYNLQSKGSYIILCISNNDDKAKDVIKQYID